MSESKIIAELKSRRAIDERGLYCHSNSSITTTKNYVVATKYTTVKQEGLPRFMLLAIDGGKLNIFKAGFFGAPKSLFGSIELYRLRYIGSSCKDFIESHEFDLNLGRGELKKFYIQGNKKKRMKEVVDAIRSYNNEI